MFLGKLFKSASKKYKKIAVKGISFDSRKVKKGDIFFAIQGNKQSGIKFIKDAEKKGASVIITSKKTNNQNHKVPYILVKDVRKCLSKVCSNFYKQKPKKIIAVTGTNGKSSVADFFYQILSVNGILAGSIGTLGVISKNYKKQTKLTSLDPLNLHKSLQILKKNKVDHVVLEASSHGLEQKRLDGLNIKIGIFTNLTHDHLDYHKNMESYFNSKMYLFKNLLNKKSKIITDKENKEFKIIKGIANNKKIEIKTIGSEKANIRVIDNKYEDNKQVVRVLINSKIYIIEVPLIGYFQIKNLLMAILAANFCGLSLKKIFSKIKEIRPVPGRLEYIARLSNNSSILVDFAHTTDALEKSLIAIKHQFKKNIVLVFGCGGERDKNKRFIMGKIANKYCKKIYVTDDNPRSENPKKIRNAIIKGCKKLAVDIGSRELAMKIAITHLMPNEILLIAGKGNEAEQDYGNKKIKFLDKKVIKEIINKEKIFFKKENYKNILLQKSFYNSFIKNVNYNGVSINSKNVKKNNLFFAIHGKKHDGHKFVKEALNKGAIRSIISKQNRTYPQNKIIKVKDTLYSLNNLAKNTRDSSTAKIIGITGSVGKTTLKNLISFSLEKFGKTFHSPHSYNNKYGVPLSVSNLKSDTKYGVFEIGMDKKGEIDQLSKIVKPEIAIITNISEAHLKNFNTLKDIAKAKSEIINNIVENGSIVLNKDDNYYEFLCNKARKKKINIISFSFKRGSDIYLSGIKRVKNYYRLKIVVKDKVFYFNSKNSNKNFLSNILACISVLFFLNLNLKIMRNKFIKFIIPGGRGDLQTIKRFNKKFNFIDESYNANPLSMLSAINNMNFYKRKNKEKKIAFLGDMLELGKKSKKFHRKLSPIINKSDIDKVFVYGKHIKETFNFLSANKKGKVFDSLNDAYNHFSKILDNNDLLMIKGSNATGLNKFSKILKKGQVSVI